MIFGGSINWLLGGIWRTGMKRIPMMKAVYVYNFGKFPSEIKLKK